jgi:hypothetical protein
VLKKFYYNGCADKLHLAILFCDFSFTSNIKTKNIMSKKSKPEFMIIYQCAECNLESGYTELDKPVCRYCDTKTVMTIISKEKLTAEVMAARLKKVTDSMVSNLVSAFESMTENDKKLFSDGDDPEKEMLLLLEKAKKFKDDVQALELKDQQEIK